MGQMGMVATGPMAAMVTVEMAMAAMAPMATDRMAMVPRKHSIREQK